MLQKLRKENNQKRWLFVGDIRTVGRNSEIWKQLYGILRAFRLDTSLILRQK